MNSHITSLSFSDPGRKALVAEAVQTPQLTADAVKVKKVSGMTCLKCALSQASLVYRASTRAT